MLPFIHSTLIDHTADHHSGGWTEHSSVSLRQCTQLAMLQVVQPTSHQCSMRALATAAIDTPSSDPHSAVRRVQI